MLVGFYVRMGLCKGLRLFIVLAGASVWRHSTVRLMVEP